MTPRGTYNSPVRRVLSMKSLTFRIALLLGSIVFYSSQLLASVTVTQPTGGQNISTDKSLNSTNGAGFTSLGSIVITEGATTDFSPGNNQTLILTLPAGWRFNAGAGSVTFTGSRDITAASIAVSASSLTVTFSVGGTGKSDSLTISGLQVQPLDGSLDPNAGYLMRLSANPGTAIIPGIVLNTTPFAALNTIPGTPKSIGIMTQPAGTANAGVIFAPQPELS